MSKVVAIAGNPAAVSIQRLEIWIRIGTNEDPIDAAKIILCSFEGLHPDDYDWSVVSQESQ